MSEEKPAPASTEASTDAVKATTEKLAGFVQWIAELIQKRNWFTLLLLVDVVLFFALKPQGGILIGFLKQYFDLQVPNWYEGNFWILLGSVFLAAIAVAVKTMPRAGKLEVQEGGERKVIKGLRAFTAEDADVFAKLQRDQSIQTCLECLEAKEFRFGVLMGESGCGKSSFLQAGLLPRLDRAESSCHGIYIKFSDRDPIETVKDALVDGLLAIDPSLNRANPEFVDLLKLMQVAPQVLQKPVVLFFDQFEQVFVHQRQKADRQPFIDTLTAWYQAESPAPLKILVSIRADLVHELYELHQAMGYTLGRYNVFKLEKFEPEEAAEVLRVIAETEGWEFDRSFVMQLARQDLASSQGKVSPVDLQILAETVRKQPATRRAFTEATFRQMGGLEGLLNRYLEETLEVLKLNNLYQAAILVLLALIDRERNLRAGVLTLTELEARLQGTVRPNEVQQATNWLTSSEVRLITPIEQQSKSGYELAHERIIPAIVRLAGQELKAAERANQLLDRRVNEWLGNGRSRDYLLSWRELWLLRQQQAYLVWGANRRDKEKLLGQSWQGIYRAGRAILTVLILFLAGFAVWLSPPGQRWQMQSQLAGLRQKLSDGSRQQAALAFVKVGNQQQASKMIDSMDVSSAKVYVLSAIAETYSRLNDPEMAKPLLEQARASAEQTGDSYLKANALSTIAAAYTKLNDPEMAKPLLEQARASVEQIDDSSSKALALIGIAEAYSKLNAPEIAKPLLEQARASAERIGTSFFKVTVLIGIAEAYSKLNAPEIAKPLLEQARASAGQSDDASKAAALSAIAEAYSKINAPDVAKPGLKQLRASAEQIDDSYNKVTVLIAIAEAYSKINAPEIAELLLEQARASAEQSDDSPNKAYALRALARAYSNLNAPDVAKPGLRQLRASAEQIDNSSDKATALSAIAEAYRKLNAPEIAKPLLGQARASAEQSGNSFAKADVLRTIAQTYAELEDWRRVNLSADLCNSDDCKADVLATGLTVWAEHQHPELKEEEED